MSKESYAEHIAGWELPNGDSVTKGNYNLADIETKYIPIQTEVVSDSKDQTINKLQQRIAELEEQLKNSIKPKFKIDEEVFIIGGKIIIDAVIDEIYWTSCKNCFEYYTRLIYGINDVQYETIDENELFATKEEAQAKLEELKGEKK